MGYVGITIQTSTIEAVVNNTPPVYGKDNLKRYLFIPERVQGFFQTEGFRFNA
jgi:hypothetical protein